MNKLNKKNISKLLDKFKIVCYNIDTVKETILNIKSDKTIKQKGIIIMTNSEALAKAIEMCAENEEVVKKLTNIKGTYDKKAKSTDKKKEENAAANLAMGLEVLELMDEGTTYTATEIVALYKKANPEADCSTSKINTVLAAVGSDKCVIEKFKKDGKGEEKNGFTKVATETEEVSEG